MMSFPQTTRRTSCPSCSHAAARDRFKRVHYPPGDALHPISSSFRRSYVFPFPSRTHAPDLLISLRFLTSLSPSHSSVSQASPPLLHPHHSLIRLPTHALRATPFLSFSGRLRTSTTPPTSSSVSSFCPKTTTSPHKTLKAQTFTAYPPYSTYCLRMPLL
jgi:hypothetical protein